MSYNVREYYDRSQTAAAAATESTEKEKDGIQQNKKLFPKCPK